MLPAFRFTKPACFNYTTPTTFAERLNRPAGTDTSGGPIFYTRQQKRHSKPVCFGCRALSVVSGIAWTVLENSRRILHLIHAYPLMRLRSHKSAAIHHLRKASISDSELSDKSRLEFLSIAL